jgi:hypothetical protein
MTNVKAYKDKQLLDYAKTIKGFKSIPSDYWLLFVRSQEDSYNLFDDKVYLFNSEKFVMVTSCTTNKGTGGSAVVKSDQWLYNGFIYGLHKGKMECLRQNKPFYFYRDSNGDKKTDETGELFYSNIQTQFHGSTYLKGSKKVLYTIGEWSAGCFVCNINEDYEKIIALVKPQKIVSGLIIKEF